MLLCKQRTGTGNLQSLLYHTKKCMLETACLTNLKTTKTLHVHSSSINKCLSSSVLKMNNKKGFQSDWNYLNVSTWFTIIILCLTFFFTRYSCRCGANSSNSSSLSLYGTITASLCGPQVGLSPLSCDGISDPLLNT